jgi:hypothetical protein
MLGETHHAANQQFDSVKLLQVLLNYFSDQWSTRYTQADGDEPLSPFTESLASILDCS